MGAVVLWRLHGSHREAIDPPPRPTLRPALMTQSLYVETRIAGITLYRLGEFRYMRNIGDFSGRRLGADIR